MAAAAVAAVTAVEEGEAVPEEEAAPGAEEVPGVEEAMGVAGDLPAREVRPGPAQAADRCPAQRADSGSSMYPP